MRKAGSVFVLGNHVQACCWQVQRLPTAGETFQATGLTVEPGGKGLNVAIGLHRQGLDVSVMMGCGQDAAADELLKVLRQEGLDTAHVFQFPGASGWGAGLIGANVKTRSRCTPGPICCSPLLMCKQRARRSSAHGSCTDSLKHP
jgi:ribokinase